jgi:hypothetical protein
MLKALIARPCVPSTNAVDTTIGGSVYTPFDFRSEQTATIPIHPAAPQEGKFGTTLASLQVSSLSGLDCLWFSGNHFTSNHSLSNPSFANRDELSLERNSWCIVICTGVISQESLFNKAKKVHQEIMGSFGNFSGAEFVHKLAGGRLSLQEAVCLASQEASLSLPHEHRSGQPRSKPNAFTPELLRY